jgi:hypothetical protein
MTVKNSIKRLREDIHRFIADKDFDNAMSALREALKAKHTVRENRTGGERGVQYTEVPCHTTRINAAKLMLEYGFGKPATRAEINITDDTSKSVSPAEIMSRFRTSGMDLNEIVDIYAESVKEQPLELENDDR